LATTHFRAADEVFRYRWIYLGLMIALAIWAWVDVLARGVVNHEHINEHRTDFTVYTEAGAAFFDGRDPYQVSNPRGWHYLYPPMFAILVAPLHALPPVGQVGVWYVLSVAMLFGCYCELRRILDHVLTRFPDSSGASSRLMPWFCAAAVAAALLPVLNCLQRGQVEIFKLYLLMVGFRMMISGRRPRDWVAAGVVFALAGILKLTPLLPVACLLLYFGSVAWFRRNDEPTWHRPVSLAAGLGTGLVLFALLIPAALTGWNGNLRHLQTWFSKVVTKVVDVRTSDFGEDVRTVRNQSLDNAAYRFGNFLYRLVWDGPEDTAIDHPHDSTLKLPMDEPTAGLLIVVARVLALATLLLYVIRSAARADAMGPGAVFALACVATLVICPVARGCYYLLFLPTIPFVSGRLLQLGMPRRAQLFAWLPVALIWLHYLLLPSSGRIGLLGLGTTAWYLASCLLLDRRSGSRLDASPVRRESIRTRNPEPEALLATM
jgi:Glycosyltransferase family 87